MFGIIGESIFISHGQKKIIFEYLKILQNMVNKNRSEIGFRETFLE
jgi:hypothetical protein